MYFALHFLYHINFTCADKIISLTFFRLDTMQII